jgi:penicillin-binding protein 2
VGTIFEDRSDPKLVRQIPMPDEIRDPIVHGMQRVVCPNGGCGVTSDFYHKTTGENLFYDYPSDPDRRQDRHQQGANNYPWNDSSVFSAFPASTTRSRTS